MSRPVEKEKEFGKSRKVSLFRYHEQTNYFQLPMYTQTYIGIGGMENEVNK